MAFDAGKIEARLVLDKSDFNRGLDQAKADADKFARGEYKAKLGADNRDANAGIDDTQGRSDKLGKSAPTVRISADNMRANSALADTQARADKFARSSYTAKLGAADAEATAKIAQVQARIDRLSAVVSRPEVSLEARKAYTQLDVLNEQLDALGRKAPTAKVQADTAAAKAKIDELNAKLDRLEARDVEVRVKASADLLRAHSDLQKLVSDLDKVKSASGGAGTALSKIPLNVWTAVAAGLPTLISLTGVLGGAALGVGGAFASAGISALAFSAVAKNSLGQATSAYKQINTMQSSFLLSQAGAIPAQKLAIANAARTVASAQATLSKAATPASHASATKSLATAQNTYTNAVQAGSRARQAEYLKEQAVLKQLSPVQRQLYVQYSRLQNQWQALAGTTGGPGAKTGSLEPAVAGSLLPFFSAFSAALKNLPAIVLPAAAAVKDIGQNLQLLMSSSLTQRFAQFIGATGSQSLSAGGSFLVNVLKTVMELLPQFRPLIDSADSAIVRIGQDMAAWAGSASAHNGIQAFMQWVHGNSGQVSALLKNLALAVGNLIKVGAGGGGIGELRAITDILGFIAHLPASIAAPLIKVGTALALISRFSFGRKVIDIAFNWVGLGAATLLKMITGGKIDLTSKFGASAGMQKAADTMVTAAGEMQKAADTMAGGGAEGGAAGAAGTAERDAAKAGEAGGAAAGAGFLSKLKVSALGAGLATAFVYAANAKIGKGRPAGGQFARGQSLEGLGDPAHSGSALQQFLAGFSTNRPAGATAGNSLAIDAEDIFSPGFVHRIQSQIIANTRASHPGNALAPTAAGRKNTITDIFGPVTTPSVPSHFAPGPGQDAMPAFGPEQTANLKQIAQLFGVTLPEAYKLSAAAGVNLTRSWEGQGNAATAARDRLSAETAALGLMRGKSGEATQAMSDYTSSLRLNGVASSTTIAARHQLITDLENTGVHSGAATALVARLSAGIGDNANNIAATHPTRKSLIDDLTASGVNAATARTLVGGYTTAVLNNGTGTQAARMARRNLITDLENAGLSARQARVFVDNYTTDLRKIPKTEHSSITVTGQGKYSVTGVSQSLFPGAVGGKSLPTALPPPNSARGMYVTGGTPGKDSVLVNAMPGEVVVPTAMVRAGAVDHLRGSIPGFDGGGVVGQYSGTAPGAGGFAVSEYSQTVTAIEKSVAAAAAAAIQAAQKAAAAIAGATTSAIGDLPANWRAIASFLTGHGYSHAAASGIAGNVLQESGGNPESVGDGGGGLIGFTPLRPGYVTGNPGRDLATQLQGILSYNQGWGQFIPGLNSQPTAASAAAYYMNNFERPAPATENAQRREAGANAVFKAMGYAGGTGGAAPGWAKVGERGTEMVRFSGGETVLPAHVTSRVLSGRVAMPGYAGGTGHVPAGFENSGGGTIRSPNGPGPFSAKQRAADEAKLRKDQDGLARLQKTASAHVRSLRVPIDRDELYLLEHPGLPSARKKAMEASIKAREKEVAAYRKKATESESKLAQEIALLKKIIASEPAPRPGKTPPGKLPPGIGKGTKAQQLAELARDVAGLTALKKKAAARLAVLQRPVNQDELYLLEHPGLSASQKSAVNAKLKADKAAVSKYRKLTGGQESTLQGEITLLRSLTGNPKGTSYGGAGTTPGTGTGTAAGATTATTPPGHFVGTIPGPPASYGGADITGGGSGGLGPGGTGAGVPGLGSAGTAAGSPPNAAPGTGWSIPSPIPGGGPGASWSVAPGIPGVAPPGQPPASSPGASFPGGGSNVERILTQILMATRAAPAQTGGNLAGALNGTSRSALSSARWNASP